MNFDTMLLFYLLVGHALADYPLQGDFLARAKNRVTPVPGVPWWQAMTAHCLIHAGVVMWWTEVWWMAAAEFVVHFAVDDMKVRGKLTYNQDQMLHVVCKVLYVVMLDAV